MNLIIPEICWHGERERILTITIHPTLNLLLTGGSDSVVAEKDNSEDFVGYIKMWEIVDLPNEFVRFKSAITYNIGHTGIVNSLKFSPDGKYFASGSDDRQIYLWEQKMCFISLGQTEQHLQWAISKMLSGHTKEIYDLAWSKNSDILVSCGLDKNVIVWDVKKGKQLQTLDGHFGYVQGIAIDPRLKSIVSLSQDRTARIWKVQKIAKKTIKNLKFYNAFIIKKLQDPNVEQSKNYGIFLGETNLYSFVRRPDWSPDGSLFILPSGEYQVDNQAILGSYVFLRQNLQQPSAFLPSKKPTVVIRFCKKLFHRNPENQNPMIDLPYKMVFAIASLDEVMIYTTESQLPIAFFGNLHYATITDMCFRDSNLLCISSSDGYCSFIKIEDNYFGQELALEEIPEYIRVLFDQKNVQIEVEVDEQQAQQQQSQQQQQQQQQIEFRQLADGQIRKHIIPKELPQQ